MNINFKEITEGLTETLKGSINEKLPQLKNFSKKIVEEQKETLQKLAELRLAGTITDEELLSQLEDEKTTVENQLLAMKVMGKKAAQDTANAAIKFLGSTLIGIVKAAL